MPKSLPLRHQAGPAARRGRPRANRGGVASAAASGSLEFHWRPGGDPRTPAALARFFRSPAIERLKALMCEIGWRLWQREYTDGNGGNLTIRVGDNLALCTPTLMSKGFMTPADLCLVDLDGRPLAGERRPTSEVLTHFGIMKRQPLARACVHAHPPHATAFAIADVELPRRLIPEAEVFLGRIGVAKYRTPGTAAIADEVGQVGRSHQAVLMINHGVICWGGHLEEAYWKMENVDAYCRMVAIARSLGGGLRHITPEQAVELVALRRKFGVPDLGADESVNVAGAKAEPRP